MTAWRNTIAAWCLALPTLAAAQDMPEHAHHHSMSGQAMSGQADTSAKHAHSSHGMSHGGMPAMPEMQGTQDAMPDMQHEGGEMPEPAPVGAAGSSAEHGHGSHGEMHGMSHGGMPAMPEMQGMQDAMPGMQHEGGDRAPAAQTALPPNDHVPPPAPQTSLPAMSPEHMAEMMQMHDQATRGMLLVDRLERSRSIRGDFNTAWELAGWWGSDIDRLWLRSEGERGAAGTHDGRIDALWGHAWSTFWDTQLGVRHDFGQGPGRQWLAAGVQGLAPYWFETQATFYAGPRGRTALRLEASYDLRFTQRLILAPRLELNLYGKDDPQRNVRAGLSDLEAGLRLRYEFSRRLAPYVGVSWTRRYANGHGPGGEPSRDTAWLAGLRFWF
jgi:copper resistance protein B